MTHLCPKYLKSVSFLGNQILYFEFEIIRVGYIQQSGLFKTLFEIVFRGLGDIA